MDVLINPYLIILIGYKRLIHQCFKFNFAELKVDKHPVGGFGGVIGRKKGAVAISINYKGIRMVFISCHLSGMPIKSYSFSVSFLLVMMTLKVGEKLFNGMLVMHLQIHILWAT